MSIGAIFAGFIFGTIGFVGFVYGKKQACWKQMTIGIILMVYPYAISNLIALYAIGTALTAGLFIFKD